MALILLEYFLTTVVKIYLIFLGPKTTRSQSRRWVVMCVRHRVIRNRRTVNFVICCGMRWIGKNNDDNNNNENEIKNKRSSVHTHTHSLQN